MTSLLLGVSAGILGLESTNGFIFYVVGTCIVSLMIHFILVEGQPWKYFPGSGDGGRGGNDASGGAWREIWFGGGVLGEALSGYVLGWAGVGGVIR